MSKTFTKCSKKDFSTYSFKVDYVGPNEAKIMPHEVFSYANPKALYYICQELYSYGWKGLTLDLQNINLFTLEISSVLLSIHLFAEKNKCMLKVQNVTDEGLQTLNQICLDEILVFAESESVVSEPDHPKLRSLDELCESEAVADFDEDLYFEDNVSEVESKDFENKLNDTMDNFAMVTQEKKSSIWDHCGM